MVVGEDDLLLSRGDGTANPELKADFERSLDWYLEETRSYRKYYRSAQNPAVLLQF